MALSNPSYKRPLCVAAILGVCAATVIVITYMLMPETTSEEFKYTLQVITQLGVPGIFLFSCICFLVAFKDSQLVIWLRSGYRWPVLAAIACLVLLIPLLSPATAIVNWRSQLSG